MNAIDIINLPVSNDTRKAIRACTDLAVLVEALALENGKPGQVGDKGGPRASMIGLLQLRIDMLRAEAPVAEAPAAPAVVAAPVESMATPVAVLAARAADSAPTEAAEPAAEPAPVVAPAEPAQANPARDCAATFLMALRDGDTRLLATLVGVVRARDYTAEQMAEALVGAYRAQAPASTRAPRRTATDGNTPASDRNVARIKAAIESAQVVDGAVVLTAADMERASFPASWVAHATVWYGTSAQAGNAAKAAGYTPKYRKVDGQAQVVLTPVAPAAQ